MEITEALETGIALKYGNYRPTKYLF